MTTLRLLLDSIAYYWRTSLAVLLGVVAGTAVIGGALLVGDSVRGSLRSMTYIRLGEVDHALTSHRFFRENLASELDDDPDFRERFTAVAPALVMQGGLTSTPARNGEASAEPLVRNAGSAGASPSRRTDVDTSSKVGGDDGPTTRRIGKLTVYGLDERLWNLTDHGALAPPRDDEIILSPPVAEALTVSPGETVSLWIELPVTVPRDSLLGERDETAVEIELTVAVVLDEHAGVGRLSLTPNQQAPPNAFVSLKRLQRELRLHERSERVGRTRVQKLARINALFVQARDEADRVGNTAEYAAEALSRQLDWHVRLEDLHLRLVPNEEHGYLSLESEQQILENALAEAGRRTAERLGLAQSPVLVYLANEITQADRRVDLWTGRFGGAKDSVIHALVGLPVSGILQTLPGYSMYSVVAGVDLSRESPFGPFEFIGAAPDFPLRNDEIVLNEWLAADLWAGLGDRVRIKYHVVGSHGELPEEERTFIVRGIVRLDGTRADDRGLTPEVEGITTADTFADWEQPFEMALDRISGRDEAYWKKYRATPKVFLSLAHAQQLWRSRYGQLTSLRVAARLADRAAVGQVSNLPSKNDKNGESPAVSGQVENLPHGYEQMLLEELTPAETGLAFRAVKFEGLQAADGTTNFSGLFLAFSFFLILSATILIGLLFRLGLERRGTSVGLLSAVGFSPARVRRLFLAEGLIVVIAGGLFGTAAAAGYAWLMIYGLKTWWHGAVRTRLLDLHVEPASLAIGFAASVVIASLALWWGLRQLRLLSARELLSGSTERSLTAEGKRRRGRLASRFAAVTAGMALLVLGGALFGLIPAAEAFGGFSWQVVAFFLVGILLLTAGLAALAAWLDSDRSLAVRGAGLAGTGRLGMRNAARHRQRSVLTASLIASAMFVIVAVAAGHRNPAVETPEKDSGNGGFTLVAESSTPILHDLNTAEGRGELNLAAPLAGRAGQARRLNGDDDLVNRMNVMPFRVKPGEDSSCLNIYQTRLPTILGVPRRMIERGGFKFVGANVENPWTLLNEQPKADDGVPVYPVLGDMNTLQYSLHKGVGDVIDVPHDAERPDYRLKIAGMLDGSVFQGVLLMSEENFLELYPERAGYEYFLVEGPPEQADELTALLETGLTQYGFDAEPVAVRLARFLDVQNTYLSAFQTLGGLGLLLGTLGLATVMLRNILERRSELALLRAVGFRNSNIALLVLWENAFLLLWGLLAGTASALLAMSPHLTSTGADVPWRAVGLILAGVFTIGMAAAFLAVREAVRTPIVVTLRSE